MSKKERIGGIIFAVFGLLVVLMTTQISVVANLSEPGPRLFPYISGVGMLICGMGMAITANKSDNREPFLTKEGWKRLGIVSVTLVLYYFALQILGFIIATPLFTLAIVLILSSGKKISKLAAVICAVATTAVLYLLFQKVFAIFLPTGILL